MVIAHVPQFCRCADTALACNCIARTKDINNLACFEHNPFRPWPQRSKINQPQNMNQNHGNSGSSLPVCRSVHVVCKSEISENSFATYNETRCNTHSQRHAGVLKWVRFCYASAASEAATALTLPPEFPARSLGFESCISTLKAHHTPINHRVSPPFRKLMLASLTKSCMSSGLQQVYLYSQWRA
jgi:hypothetical protein